MDPGRLEEIPLPFEQALSSLEQRVMTEIVRAIRINGFSTSTADWQTEKLIQMGKSEAEIQRYVQEALQNWKKYIQTKCTHTIMGIVVLIRNQDLSRSP